MKKQFFILIFVLIYSASYAFNGFIPATEMSGKFLKFSTYYEQKYSNFDSGLNDIGFMISKPYLLKFISLEADISSFGSNIYRKTFLQLSPGFKIGTYVTIAFSGGILYNTLNKNDLIFVDDEELKDYSVISQAFGASFHTKLFHNRINIGLGAFNVNEPNISFTGSEEKLSMKVIANIDWNVFRFLKLGAFYLREDNEDYYGLKFGFAFPFPSFITNFEATTERVTITPEINTLNYWSFKYSYDINLESDLEGTNYAVYLGYELNNNTSKPKIIFFDKRWANGYIESSKDDITLKFSVEDHDRLKYIKVTSGDTTYKKSNLREYDKKEFIKDISLKQGDNEVLIEVAGILGEPYVERINIYRSTVGFRPEGSKYPKQAYPPDLVIENLTFVEPSLNQALDAEEKGEIQFDLINKGRGNAYELEIKLTPLSSAEQLIFPRVTKVNEVPKESMKKYSIPITADFDVQTMTRQFRLEIMEGYGFDADPSIITFETQACFPPNLQINQIAIDDDEKGDSYGNGNSVIESGESVEVTAFVQNYGIGSAINVKAHIILETDDPNITYIDEGKTYNLGDIESGDYKELEFYFYTSKRYETEKIPISVRLTENTGRFGCLEDLDLKLGERTPNILDIHIARVETKKSAEIREIEGVIKMSDVDIDIPVTDMNGENTLAVIIGIEKYKYAPDVDFALNDALSFYKYAKNVFRIPERNIYFQTNEGATSGEFHKIFSDDGWIARRIKHKISDVIIYYSGHGAPDMKSKEAYLIPYDIDPNYAYTGHNLNDIYTSLSRMNAKSVTVFIDACFSGESRSKEMLIAGIRPISIKIESPILTTENMAVFSASSGEQYSSAYPEKYHGLFTYFLLKGLNGTAKGNDNKLTLNELFIYLKKNVSETAGYLDKEQIPTFIGRDKDRVFIKY